ncbi:MAG: hypothetical protein SVY53_03140 [Chloroflexota bacterium]|nr:hypothetical protein [Chloroflexota bacterium]
MGTAYADSMGAVHVTTAVSRDRGLSSSGVWWGIAKTVLSLLVAFIVEMVVLWQLLYVQELINGGILELLRSIMVSCFYWVGM